MLVTLAVLASLALLARRFFAGYEAPREPYARLAPREAAFLSATAETLFPRGGAISPSGVEAGVTGFVDRYLGDVPPRMSFLMRCLFALFEHATLVVAAPGAGGRRRFSALDDAQRAAVLERWRRARFFPMRLVFTSLRAILTMGYFASPAVLRELRLAPYDIPVPVVPADLLFPPIGRGPDAIRHGPGSLTTPSDGRPLALDGPLHPAYAAGAPPRTFAPASGAPGPSPAGARS